jgi:dTDP-4-amino-4,6-dideoxygalactose transaminase
MKDFEHIKLPYQAKGCNSSWHLYTILVKDGKRKESYTKLKEAGIGVDVHYLPVYRHPYYRKHGYENVICPNAEAIYAQILSIPIYYKLTDEQQSYVIEQIRNLA